ncbi:MAG: class I SAM-dependent methyltransferase [Cytophagaceae bacterium]|nr:class I SAM-dependent methyltransferase [Cytophagaceae bacterium]
MKDLFSTQAETYARYRPTYPPELYDFVLGQVSGREAAWDCATGNGQVALELAKQFDRVEATDLSEKQLEQAVRRENIHYQVAKAENTPFSEQSFDLITVGQALHWLNPESFHREVARVLKPGGVLAVWGYELMSLTPQIDERVLHFYRNIIGSYWNPERRLLEERYASVPFPYREIACPDFQMVKRWTLDELAGYLNSWSSVNKFQRQHGYSPVGDFIEGLRPYWPGEQALTVTFPVFMRLGFKEV